jgi:hypothetical protein
MPTPLRSAHIYAAEGKPVIVAPLHFNSAGIRYEQDDPIVVENGSWEAVVPHLRDSLRRFSFRESNVHGQKLTDWPSFRASGMRSVREFQNCYLCIQIMAVNDAELFYDAGSQPHGESDITLQVTLNPYGHDEEIGRLLGKLFQSCLRWPAVMSE